MAEISEQTIAQDVKRLVQKLVNKAERNEYESYWDNLKDIIERKLFITKQQLEDERICNLVVSQLRTEGYIAALEYVLSEIKDYEELN